MTIILNYFSISYLLHLNLLFIQFQVALFGNFFIILNILIGLLLNSGKN
jgi:hypothetical protein